MFAVLVLWRLLYYLSFVQVVFARGKTIDIFNGGGEGDILQLRGIGARAGYNNGAETFRNAIFSNSRRKWNVKDSDGNTVIPYVISGKYDYNELRVIKAAMERIERNTCLRFRQRRSERDYIDIQNRWGEGCYTSVGRLFGRSILVLEANDESTCMATHIVQHELLHVAGLWHEHMRYDRDNYIRVHYENIAPGYESQFDKVPPSESTTYNIPYDYKSVMHYGKRAFALYGRISMETLDPKYSDVIGKQKDATPNDYKKVCQIYGCSQCNGGERPKGTDYTTRPWTPRPETTTPKKCSDIFPRFCSVIIRTGLMDCSYGFGMRYCCATCNDILGGRGDSSYESPDDDCYDNY